MTRGGKLGKPLQAQGEAAADLVAGQHAGNGGGSRIPEHARANRARAVDAEEPRAVHAVVAAPALDALEPGALHADAARPLSGTFHPDLRRGGAGRVALHADVALAVHADAEVVIDFPDYPGVGHTGAGGRGAFYAWAAAVVVARDRRSLSTGVDREGRERVWVRQHIQGRERPGRVSLADDQVVTRVVRRRPRRCARR